MNSFTLLNLVLHPEKAQQSDLEQIQELINEYPYFQAARLLMAKVSKSSEHIKTAAAFTSERVVLQKVINSGFNSDVNLPNIDNLEIGKDDLGLFDRLGKEEGDTKLSKEANQEFDAHFGDFQLDVLDKEEELATPDLETSLHEEKTEASDPIEEETNDSQPEEEISWPDLDFPNLEEDESQEAEEDDDEISRNDLIAEIEEEAEDYDLDGSLDDDLDEFRKLREETEQIRLAAMAAMEAEGERISHTKKPSPEIDAIAQSEENTLELEANDSSNDEAELQKLKEEAEKNRLAAEKEMEERQQEEEKQPERAKPTRNDYNPVFDLPEVKYENPKYDLPSELSEKEEVEDFTLEVVEIETSVEIEVDIFDSYSDEDELEEEDTRPLPKRKKSLFDFDDSLFSLDDLLKQATVGIDPVRELESKEPIGNLPEDDINVRDLQAKQVGIINDFIDNVPSLKAKKEDEGKPNTPAYDLTEMQKPNIVSENLATIMVKQGKYEKAIDIYKELILKFPEKRTYFASLIQNLENK